MKKIIYSLVIMIAAGSLFTSCVNYEEPVGVQDLREAKASYLDALSALRAADAELQLAYAEVQKSIAAKNNADAAYRNAQVEYQKLVNAAKEISNATDKAQSDQKIAEAEKAAAKAKADAEEAAKVHAINMANLEKQLSDLQKKIDAESLGLTAAEKKAVQDAINYYTTALGLYNTAAGKVATAEQNLWNAKYAYSDNGVSNLTEEDYIKAQEDKIAAANDMIAKIEKEQEDFLNAELTDSTRWASYLYTLNDKINEYAYQISKLKVDSAAYQAAIATPAKEAIAAATAEWEKENKAPTAPTATVKAAWPKPKYFNSAAAFATTMLSYFDVLDAVNGVPGILTVENDTIKLNGTIGQVDTLFNGDGKEENKITNLGINGIIKVIEDNELLKADEETLAEYENISKEADSTYKAHLDIIKAGRKAFIDSNAAVIAAKADTTVKADSLVLLKDNLTKAQDDSTNLFREYKKEVDTLIAARKALATAAKALNVEGTEATSYSNEDLKAILKALQDFAKAKFDVFGPQAKDTIKYFVNANGVNEESVAITNLTVDYLKQTVDSIKVSETQVQFKVWNKFTHIVENGTDDLNQLYKYNSYEVKFVATRPESLNVAADKINKWIKYDAVEHSALSNTIITIASLSKPAQEDQYDEVFTVIFKALGLVPSFWYSDEPYLTEGSQPESNWYDIVLAENPNANDLDALFSFEIGKPYTVQITASEVGKPFGLYYNEGGDKSYQPAECLAAIDSVNNAKTAANTYETTYVNSVNALATAEAAAFNEFRDKLNTFYGITSQETQKYYGEVSVEQYKTLTKDFYTTWDAEVKENVEKFVEYADLIAPYLVYDFVNGKINAQVAVEIAAGGKAEALKIQDFVINSGKTEFAKKLVANYIFATAANYKDALALLETLKGWVAEAEGQIAEYDEALATYNADVKAWNDKKAEAVKAIKEQAKWDEIEATVEQFEKDIKAAEEMKTLATSVFNAIDAELTPGNDYYVTAYEAAKARFQTEINNKNKEIKDAQWIIDQVKAGVAQKVVNEKAAERALEAAKADLAAAEEVLAIAKAQYEAVIAKYVK